MGGFINILTASSWSCRNRRTVALVPATIRRHSNQHMRLIIIIIIRIITILIIVAFICLAPYSRNKKFRSEAFISTSSFLYNKTLNKMYKYNVKQLVVEM